MTRGLLTLLLFVLSYAIHAQVVVDIQDSSGATPIKNAQIFVVELDQILYTNSSGKALFFPGKISEYQLRISASGYEGKVITYKEGNLIKINLLQSHIDLHEVTLSGTTSQRQDQNPFHIESRKMSELTLHAPMNMGEILAKIPGVYQSSLGNGISKPVIRGMQGMRIVSLVNGLRIEGQQWGGDHGMGMAELGIGSVEVIKGPSSLLYGADALGGVIYYNDAPFASAKSYDIQLQSLFNSNTMGTVNRAILKTSGQKWRLMVAGSYANHADFKLPNQLFAKNSRFDESVLKAALSFNAKRSVHHFRYTYNKTITGIPGHSHDSIVDFSSFQVSEQKRKYELPAQFFSNHYFSNENKWYFKNNELNALFGLTSNQLIEYDEKVTIPSLSMTLNNLLYTIKWSKKWSNNLKSVSGIQGMAQSNRNAENASDTLIPNSNTIDNGIFSTWIFEREKWNFQGGMRYDVRSLNSLHNFNNKSALTRIYGGLNISIGSIYKSSKLLLKQAISTGFRAPHLTELLSNGFHHGALRFEIGDTDLKPERASQYDVTLELNHEHLVLVVNPFVNYIQNYVFIQPIDSMVEGIKVFEYRQQNQVFFYGTDIGFHYHPHFAHKLHWESSFSYVNAHTGADSSISLIPQPRLANTLRLDLNLGQAIKFKDIALTYVFCLPQNNVAYNETQSSAYNLVDFSGTFEYSKKSRISLNVGVKNLLNQQYIDHLSRLKNIAMYAPSRTFFISLQWQLNNVNN
ncbi:MAG: TonB-dependent receptor [Bacteroidetes bacterium]|nr:TonB-dependent receptor [Bacteroidota bacterium]